MNTSHPLRNVASAFLGIFFASSSISPAAELLTNGSFDNDSAWTVVPPQTGWTCIANGEALLHPSTPGYVGTIIKQPLSIDITSSRMLEFSATLSKPGAPPGYTIMFKLTYLDGSATSKEIELLSPSNDDITTETLLKKRITLPADAVKITEFSVYKNDFGTFTLQGASLKLLTGTRKPEIVVLQPDGSELTDGGNYNMGKVLVRDASQTRVFTIKNIGKAALSSLYITKQGANRSDFIVTKLPNSTLDPGLSMRFKVTFDPLARRTRNATLRIKSNDADENPFDINLTGVGAGP